MRTRSGEFKMAEEMELFDADKKRRIDDELLPDLDDAVLRVARMRKNQVSKCKCEARNIVANSVKYYSNVTVDNEPTGDKCSFNSLDINKYGPIDFSAAQNMPAFNKELMSCLNEVNDLKKCHQLKAAVEPNERGKLYCGRFSRIKSSHRVPIFH